MSNLSKNLTRIFTKIMLIPLIIREKFLLRNKDFIIVSNNCWGYSLYNTMNRPYNTPFVGLFIPPDSYIALLKNFPNSLNETLKFIETEKTYPVAYLGDAKIEIHFMHYKSVSEAEEKWSRRVIRLLDALEKNEELFFKFCDSEKCTTLHLEQYYSLSFQNQISFTLKAYSHPNNIHVPYLRNEKTDAMVNGLQLYKNRYRCFDFAQWILTGAIFTVTNIEKQRE